MESSRAQFLGKVRIDPDLGARVTLRAMVDIRSAKGKQPIKRFSDLADTLRQLADQTGLSILGDYDPCWDDYYTRIDPYLPDVRMKKLLRDDVVDVPAWKAFEFVADHFDVTWEKHGRLIMVRSPRVGLALSDKIDLLDPAPLPHYWQKVLRTYKPGDRLPNVIYKQ